MEEFHVFHSIEEAATVLEDPVVTIGNFDGVHIGHQELLRRCREASNRHDDPAVALTFSPHPVRFFRPDADEFRLTTDPKKFELIHSHGIDAVVALHFDQKIANLSPESFVDRIIAAGLGARRVIVGANFAFGKDRAGTTDDLRRLSREREIAADILEEVTHDGEVVSSTRIRDRLAHGDVSTAARLLGRNYRVSGTVVSGEGRGGDLGFPTANLDAENLVPEDGIYATFFHRSSGGRLAAATSIGWRPTFEGSDHAVEAYILDRDDLDLYGEEVELEFVEYIRPEREFPSSDELIEQIRQDVEQTRGILEG